MLRNLFIYISTGVIVIIFTVKFSAFLFENKFVGHYRLVNADNVTLIINSDLLIQSDSSYYIDIDYFSCKTNLFGTLDEKGEWTYLPGDFADFLEMKYDNNIITFKVKVDTDSTFLSNQDLAGLYLYKIN